MKSKEYYEAWEKQKLREKVQELTKQTRDQQALLKKLVLFIERQTGGTHTFGGYFVRNLSDTTPSFSIGEKGKAVLHRMPYD